MLLIFRYAIYHTETLTWSALQLTSKGPGARTGHTATHVTLQSGDDALVIFGGKRAQGDYIQDLHVINLNTAKYVDSLSKKESLEASKYV